MKNQLNVQKFKKLTKILRKVMQFLFVACIVCACLALAGIIFVLPFLSDKTLSINPGKQLDFFITMGGSVRYDVPNMTELVNIRNIINSLLAAAFAGFCLLAPFFRLLSQILRTVEDDKPFDEQNSNKLSRMGIILIVGSVLMPVFESIVTRSIVNAFKIPNISISYSLNLTMLTSGLLLFILSGIFRYGAFLQQEHDETV